MLILITHIKDTLFIDFNLNTSHVNLNLDKLSNIDEVKKFKYISC